MIIQCAGSLQEVSDHCSTIYAIIFSSQENEYFLSIRISVLPSIQVLRCFVCLFVLPSIFLVNVKVAKSSFLILFPCDFNCVSQMQRINHIYVPTVSITLSFLTASLRCSSAASSLFLICEGIFPAFTVIWQD